MTVWRASADNAPERDLATSSKKHNTAAAEESALCPVKIICVMASMKVRVKTVLVD